MDEQVAWHVALAVKPGAREDFRALTSEMVEPTREEPGVLSYERFVSTVHRLRDPERGVTGDAGQSWRNVHGPVWWLHTLGSPSVSR
jgi:hypothetical protein